MLMLNFAKAASYTSGRVCFFIIPFIINSVEIRTIWLKYYVLKNVSFHRALFFLLLLLLVRFHRLKRSRCLEGERVFKGTGW